MTTAPPAPFPCPRCGAKLVRDVRWRYEDEQIGWLCMECRGLFFRDGRPLRYEARDEDLAYAKEHRP